MLSTKQLQNREHRLTSLARSLNKKPKTATQVAAEESITKATAYAWIKILLSRKLIRLSGWIRGSSGGWAKVYGPVVTRSKS